MNPISFARRGATAASLLYLSACGQAKPPCGQHTGTAFTTCCADNPTDADCITCSASWPTSCCTDADAERTDVTTATDACCVDSVARGDDPTFDPNVCQTLPETGYELFGARGSGTLTFPAARGTTSGSGATGFTGTTELYDEATTSFGPIVAGDLLCSYVYPATGTPWSLTQSGFGSDNQVISVTCDACDFAFTLTHDVPTTVRAGYDNGAYCDRWGYTDAGRDTAFPTTDQTWNVAFSASYDDPTTEAVETDPMTMSFYDGTGTYLYYNADQMAEVEYPAAWLAVAPGTLDGTTWTWDTPLVRYRIFEPAYYQ